MGKHLCHRMPQKIIARTETDGPEHPLVAVQRSSPVESERQLKQAVPGTRLVWSAMPDGTIIVRAKTRSILDMAGILKAPKGKRVTVEDMNPWR